MKILVGERGSGITTDLLAQALETGGIYICATKKKANDLAQNFRGRLIFTTFYEFSNNVEKFKNYFEESSHDVCVYIDDFELILKNYFNQKSFPVSSIIIGTTLE